MSDEDYSDDDLNPSDATLILAREVNEQFKKEFPLKRETVEKKERMAKLKYTPAMCRKLNFDETISPINVEMTATRVTLNSTKQKLSFTQNEVENLKFVIEEKDEKIEELMNERAELRQKYNEMEAQKNMIQGELELKMTKDDTQLEYWKAIGRKYYIWYRMASSQLEVIKDLVEKNGKWDSEQEITKINNAAMDVFKLLKDESFTDEYAEQLASGSIQSFSGVEFKAQQLPIDASILECARRTADISSIEIKPTTSEQTMLNNTDMNSTIQEHTFMTDGGPLNLSSIEFEKDEKIQRLLLENSVLKDAMNVSRGRIERSMLIEEANRSLEVEKQSLKERLDLTFSEIEALRVSQARKYFDSDAFSGPMDNQSKQLKLIDRITKLQAENLRLEKEFASATSRIMRVSKDLKECERRNDNLEDVYSKQINECIRLKKELTDNVSQIAFKNEEIESLNKKLIEAATFKVPAAPTDAGNSTQIFHMATNPLEAAHAEYQESESRKRKLDNLTTDDDNDAKRRKDELIEDLEERLQNCEREKNVIEDGFKLHKDLASKFRQVCVALTGLQIKLKDADEGICTVQSEYEGGTNEKQFVFKCFYGTTRIDMLDVNCASSSEMIQKWEPIMKKYIGERNSIPAFLAAVTLQLEKEREFDETMHERTHTFSVLHED